MKLVDLDGLKYTIQQIKSLISQKVDKVVGKDLSTNDYTTEEKDKLTGIENNANKYIHPSTHDANMITESVDKRFVSDIEKTNWNEKATTDYVDSKVSNVTGLAPETLNSLDKLATAIGNDPDFVTTITNEIGNKVDKVSGMGLSTNDYTTTEKNKLSTIEENANNYVHPVSGIVAGKYNSVTVDNDGHVINGTNPTTLSGYGITDAYTKDETNLSLSNKVDVVSGKGLSTNDYTTDNKAKVDKIVTSGDGNLYLANDGTYKMVSSGSGTTIYPVQIKVDDPDNLFGGQEISLLNQDTTEVFTCSNYTSGYLFNCINIGHYKVSFGNNLFTVCNIEYFGQYIIDIYNRIYMFQENATKLDFTISTQTNHKIIISDANIYSNVTSSQYTYGMIYTTSMIDTTGYSKLHVKYSISSGNVGCIFGLASAITSYSSYTSVVASTSNTTVGSFDQTIDISNYQGNYYVYFYLGTIIGYIYDIYLEL